MTEFIMLGGFLICDCPRISRTDSFKAARLVFGMLCIAASLGVLALNLQKVQAEYEGRAAADERWNSMMDYCRKNGNNYYVIDVYSATSYQNVPYAEKIFVGVDNAYRNFDLCGGWAAKSPLARQKLARYHFRDIQGALGGAGTGGQARAYFLAGVDKDLDWLVQYYGKRGAALELRCVDQIRTGTEEAAFNIYELARK